MSREIARYRQGFNKLIIYDDHVDLGTMTAKSYPLERIADVVLARNGFEWGLALRLSDGTTTEAVLTKKSEVEEAKARIEALFDESEISSCPSFTPVAVIRCTVLGGSGSGLAAGDVCTAAFGDRHLQIKSASSTLELDLTQLKSLDVSGPGWVESDAGIIGGGFGLGAVVGIGVAAALNALSRTSSVNTVLALTWAEGELFLHTSRVTPDEARLALSHVFTAIRAKAPMPGPESDLVAQLERLANLRDAGILTESEFSEAKSKLLDNGA